MQKHTDTASTSCTENFCKKEVEIDELFQEEFTLDSPQFCCNVEEEGARFVADVFLRSGELVGLARVLEEFGYIATTKPENAGVHVYDFTGPLKLPTESLQKMVDEAVSRRAEFVSLAPALSPASHFLDSAAASKVLTDLLCFRFSQQEDIGHMVIFNWCILQVNLAVLHEGLSSLE